MALNYSFLQNSASIGIGAICNLLPTIYCAGGFGVFENIMKWVL